MKRRGRAKNDWPGKPGGEGELGAEVPRSNTRTHELPSLTRCSGGIDVIPLAPADAAVSLALNSEMLSARALSISASCPSVLSCNARCMSASWLFGVESSPVRSITC